MSKYIEVNVLKEQIRKTHGIRSLDYLLPIEKEIVKEVDSAPTIDIVHCRECKYWGHVRYGIGICAVLRNRVKEGFFCGFGKGESRE